MTERRFVRDQSLYRKLSEPFASPDVANAALEAFHADVRALREKHRIADLVTVAKVNVTYPDGVETGVLSLMRDGNSTEHLGMLAYAYGREQAEHRELMNKLAEGRKP